MGERFRSVVRRVAGEATLTPTRTFITVAVVALVLLRVMWPVDRPVSIGDGPTVLSSSRATTAATPTPTPTATAPPSITVTPPPPLGDAPMVVDETATNMATAGPAIDAFLAVYFAPTGNKKWVETISPLVTPSLARGLAATNQDTLPVGEPGRLEWVKAGDSYVEVFTPTPDGATLLRVGATNFDGEWLVSKLEPTVTAGS